jgi:hypothetical protein
MSSGWAALAFSLYLGKRRGYGTERLAVRPSSVANVVLGTALLWFGWFGEYALDLSCLLLTPDYWLQRRLDGKSVTSLCSMPESDDFDLARHVLALDSSSDGHKHCGCHGWSHLDGSRLAH